MPSTANRLDSRLIGRDAELSRLLTALRTRRSLLLWGPADAGKTALINSVLSELPEAERRRCIYRAGIQSCRELIEHLLEALYRMGDPLMRRLVRANAASKMDPKRWLGKQSARRLGGILISAAAENEYRFFLDHAAPVSDSVARLLKEIMRRTKSAVYLTGHGYLEAEIGPAWSLFWTNEYRIQLKPLSHTAAQQLLDASIRRFDLKSLGHNGFRDDVLRFSKRLPGSIVKMCRMASKPRYHEGGQIKIHLIHVDYLLQASRIPSFEGHAQ